MKRITALLLALLLFLTAAPATAEAGVTVYASDFTRGTDGWEARSTGSASIAVSDGALRITGRQSDWHSPGRTFALIAGGEYVLSVEVRQDEADSAAFMISVAHTRDGGETYENLARGTAKKGEWTAITGTWTAGEYDRYVLYVETTSAPTLSYEIRNFRVEAPNGLPEPRPTEPPAVVAPASDVPSLKEIYAGRFDFGCCVNQWQARNPRTMAFVSSQYNILTPENELKPDAVLDVNASRRLAQEDETAAAVHFDSAKPLLDYAKQNGLKVHGHVLVWHSQTPEAFFHEGYDASKPLVSREVMLGRMENYIRGVMTYMAENYPGVVVSWDVVNEAVDDNSGRLRSSPWLKTVGDDYLHRAFAFARQYAPEGTLLYYNDYNTAYLRKQNGIVELLESLIPEGNIDGYGFQMHHAVSQPGINLITESVERIAGLPLRLRVSELDVTTSNSASGFEKQAKLYADIMKLLDRFSDRFEAVQVWGVTDGASWRASQCPLLFDDAFNPKPAFWAVADPDSVE